MSDEPPVKKFTLKPKEFERVNAPAGEAGPPSPAHDVFALRQEIREREIAAGMDLLEPKPKKKSRRSRDYWLVMLLLNGLFAVALRYGWGNAVVMIFAVSGIVLGSVALTWVMWFVIDDY